MKFPQELPFEQIMEDNAGDGRRVENLEQRNRPTMRFQDWAKDDVTHEE
jgi:hypothetical protein